MTGIGWIAPEGTPPPTIDDDGNVWFGETLIAKVKPGSTIQDIRPGRTAEQQTIIDNLNRRLKENRK
jgi:hypothetical protein